jgi:iron complex outermembrane receptor protein
VTLPTAGKDAPNAPRRKAGLSVEYQDGPFWVRLKARATSKQYASLMNDEVAPGYTTFGLDGGYTFANYGWLKRPKLTFNVSNLTDKQFRNPSSTTVLNSLPYQGLALPARPATTWAHHASHRLPCRWTSSVHVKTGYGPSLKYHTL